MCVLYNTNVHNELEEARDFSEAVISAVRDGVVAYDTKFRYTLWSYGMEKLTGLPAKDVLGKRGLELFPHLREHGVDELLQQALAGKMVQSPEMEYVVDSTGQTGWMVGRYTPHLNGAGDIIGVVGVVSEVSKQVWAAEHQRQQALESEQQRRMAQLGVIAGGLAHDFNNILTAIMGNAELAGLVIDGTEGERSLLRIIQVAERGTSITQDVLAYAGKGVAPMVPINLFVLIFEKMRALRDPLRPGQRLMILPSRTSRLCNVLGNAVHLDRVLMNLVRNASHAGSTQISIKLGLVTDNGALPDDWGDFVLPCVLLQVQDNGEGMNEETRSKMFDLLFTTKGSDGTGMGMSIVQSFVHGHGGRIMVTSTQGIGTTVSIVLPQASASDAEENAYRGEE